MLHKPLSLKDKKSLDLETPLSLIDSLLINGLITQSQLHIAKIEQAASDLPLERLFIKLGFLSESLLTDFKTKRRGLDVFNPSTTFIDPKVVHKLSRAQAERFQVLPLSQQDQTLFVAAENEDDIQLYDQLRPYYPGVQNIISYIATAPDLQKAIEKNYAQTLTIEDLLQKDHDIAASQFLQALLLEGVRRGASDIHFEPEAKFVTVRFRIDGILHQICAYHQQYGAKVTVRLKTMAGLNIAESRLPQDGRFTFEVGGRDVDIRVSSLPTQHGENLVLRLLDKFYTLKSLEQLGFSEDQVNQIKKMLEAPEGILIMTGPTGSGKTTTLYSMLMMLSTPEVNIMTLEDPIEYELTRIRQTEIRESKGLGFAEGLRSILRQDPDIILIGEIRDTATAQMAVRASMTGHFVLTTLHTQDVFGVFPRLLDLGLPARSYEGALRGILGQRLLRKLCPHCKRRTIQDSRLIFKPQGCEACYHSGYQGRTGILEILSLDESLEDLLERSANRKELRQYAKKQGFQSLKDQALHKVYKGETSFEEMTRVVGRVD